MKEERKKTQISPQKVTAYFLTPLTGKPNVLCIFLCSHETAIAGERDACFCFVSDKFLPECLFNVGAKCGVQKQPDAL